ncbi:hypothetical protein CAPTEDRAFT_224955 [Capitella teleta]|uniref:DNA-directed primase/polymerase protein n=1 Tax=Capitella teleta TaxID=283909 RepID=R7TWM1_CAPTE|nr:hypothetical protein CAPTEDRAFT_224955 [Capitella teleta]|eukprot:ELT98007.1 hypothetical protein CAPTEDRAFT_224955 [Capitella teleta]
MDKTSFYGKKGLARAKNWKERLRSKEHEFYLQPALTQYRPKLDSPSAHWKIFYRQKEAFHFARSQSKELHVFAFESETFQQKGGQRLYLVASLEHFWHYYQGMNRHQRHHYELIPEGAVCRLYFDLEFQRAENPDKDGHSAVAVLIQYICACLKKRFQVNCCEKDVLILDASTPSKFSQHLIFHMAGAAFKCNVTAGNFVHSVMRLVLEEVNSQTCAKAELTNSLLDEQILEWSGLKVEQLKELICKDKDGKDSLIVDLGVYTRNRNFRLYLSCKMGKNNPLLTAAQNQFCCHQKKCKTRFIKPSTQQQLFLDSLVTASYENGMRILTCDEDPRLRNTSSQHSDRPTDFLEGFQSSPYPEVDAFISERAKRWGGEGCPPGSVRQWVYFSHGQIIIYNIVRNRWCANIGRMHKSNKIMLIADLKHRVFYQKCHDPDCKAVNYKSPDEALPRNVLPSLFSEEVADEDLLKAANEIEAQELNFSDVNEEDLLNAMEEVEGAKTAPVE